jgi:hypothetical protein
MKSPDDLAVYTKCEPERIAYWIDNSISYQEQGNYWLPAGASMSLRSGDCKAMATIAKDTLNRCVGYEARILIIRNVADVSCTFGNKTSKCGTSTMTHAITVFTDHNGKRGFIDGGNFKIYPGRTEWKDVLKGVPGGPWTAQ